MKAKMCCLLKRILGPAICLGLALGIAPAVPAGATEKVDQVVVMKKARRMTLLSAGRVVRAYTISLGDNPRGHKTRQGDERTPEGLYKIDYRNLNSRYHLSLHISYPNAADRERAAALGVDPGGMIMIHGSPNHWQWAEGVLKQRDWTNGCIAVSNAEIEEIWELVADGTPIEIKP